MKTKQKIIQLLVLFITLFLAGCDSNTAGFSGNKKGNLLTASGVVEAVQINISSQVNAQVLEVLVEDGDQVQEGDILILLDKSILQAQVNQATSMLNQAQSSYDLLVAGGSSNIRNAAIAAAEMELLGCFVGRAS